jgi:hypothetical protein
MTAQGYKVSFCITCKGRLEHLKQTLPQNLRNNANYPNTEFVILDYDSPDGLEDWIRKNFQAEIDSGKIRYAKFQPAPHFKMAHAKNMAHRVATGDVLCNLDADNVTGPGFAKWLNEQFTANPNSVVRVRFRSFAQRVKEGHLFDNGYGGRIAIGREHFEKLHGYDERFNGWGNDDNNFIQRTTKSGLNIVRIPESMRGSVIDHGDKERTVNLEPELKAQSEARLDSKHRLPAAIGRKIKRALAKTGLVPPVVIEPAPPANTDGHYGCGTVRINFKEDLTLGPAQPVIESPVEPEGPIPWLERVASKDEPGTGRAA